MRQPPSSLRIGPLWLLVFTTVAAVTSAWWFFYRERPEHIVERVLAIKLPGSASHTAVSYRWMPDSKVIKLWAVMDIPLNGAQTLAHDAGLPQAELGNSISMPDPAPMPAWWAGLKAVDLGAVSTKWLKQAPEFRPAFFAMVWSEGKAYIFYFGVQMR